MSATPTHFSRHDRLIAIVGRPNVGKSALFNRLAGRRIAIVHDRPGVTRDRLSAPVKDAAFPLTVMDTGGIGATLEDDFAGIVRTEAEIAIAAADAILFVVDALEGMHPIDQGVADLLRRQGKPVILGINKADDPKHDHMAADFGRLGFRSVCAFSAEHGRGIPQLLKAMESAVGAPAEAPDPDAEDYDPNTDPRCVRLAIVGRPNVGKSSLFNAILGDDRAIVSDVAGTTRDAIDSFYNHRGHPYLLMDTAGIRRQAKVDDAVEAYSVRRAERSIRRADVVALVIDAARGVTAQERKIAGTIVEENKPCILVANKFDLYHPDGEMKARLAELEEHVRRELFFLHYAPLVAVSARQRDRLGKIFGAIDKVRAASDAQMNTGAFNRLLQDAINRTPPPAIGGKRFKLFYATLAREEKPRPVSAPRVVLFVNHESLMTPTYRRYLENIVRQHMTYEGLPIRFDVREREQRTKGKSQRQPRPDSPAAATDADEPSTPRPPSRRKTAATPRPQRKTAAAPQDSSRPYKLKKSERPGKLSKTSRRSLAKKKAKKTPRRGSGRSR
jgi:GTP-binding protein